MNDKWSQLLGHVGLQEIIHAEQHMNNEQIFTRYSSKEYLSSSLHETDEEFGFRNVVLLHLKTGLRFEYALYEDYFENVEYKILDVFIKVKNGKRISVSSIDFDNAVVLTTDGNINFTDIKRDIVGD